MATIGYIRVSSNKQTHEHQKYEIEQFAKHNQITIDKWVEETISSRKPLNKRQLGNLLDELSAGDILIACEISRLGRSLLEVMKILLFLYQVPGGAKACKNWSCWCYKIGRSSYEST